MIKRILITTLTGLSAATAYADHRQHDMRVDGITCPFCVASSSKVLKEIEGVYWVTTDLEAGVVSVCAEPQAKLNDEYLTQVFGDTGFTYRGKTISEGCTNTDVAHVNTKEAATADILVNNSE